MRRKKRFARLLALFLLVSLFTCSHALAAAFPDTPAWCSEAISDMASKGILSGFQDGSFKPDQAMTRAQMAKVLQLIYVPEIDREYMMKDEVYKEHLEYADELNGADHWASAYIGTANAISIQEFGHTYAEWSKPATRYEMAHMASQYAALRQKLDGESTDLFVMKELIPYIGDYATFQDREFALAVLWMYTQGFVNGSDSTGSFKPDSTITRAQACAILYRIQNESARVSVTWTSSPVLSNTVGFQGGEYKPGSVYGPKLNQKELDQVKDVVKKFVEGYITKDMSDYEKVEMAQEFLSQTCSYAPDWSKNHANTAWGALIYHEAQCSGYARAMKALCDGMGVGCYYVHADKSASNPSHQFNIVQVDGNWYVVDPQLNGTTGGYWPAFLVSERAYTSLTGITWDHSGLPDCPSSYS